MIVKIINGALMLFAIFMGIKQGYTMTTGKPEMIDMFSKWNFGSVGLMAMGVVTMLSAVFIAFPKTFIWGNFLMAATILLIMCFHLLDKDLKGFAIELPFFFLNLLIIYLQHPLAKG